MINKLILLTLLLICSYQSFPQNWDINTLRDINLNRNRQMDGTFQFISNTTSPISFGVPIVLFGVGYLQKDSLTKHKAVYIGTTLIVASLIAQVAKQIVKRDRPFITYTDIEKIGEGDNYSMPSGHTSSAFALATSVSVAYPKWYIVAPSFAWAGAVGYSRLHLGVHYPSDVIVGAVVGSGSAYLSYKLNKWLFRTKNKLANIKG